MIEYNKLKSIVVVRHQGLGDVLMMTPVVYWIHQRYPDLRIEVDTMYPQVFRDFPGVVRAERFSIPPGQVFIQGGFFENSRQLHPTIFYLHQAETDFGASTHMRLYSRSEDVRKAEHLLQNVERPITIMHIQPSWTQMESGMEQGLVDMVQAHSSVVMVGQGSCTVKGPKVHNLYNKTGTLHELYEVIRAADLYIGTDCGITHVAGCTDTPMICLYSWQRPRDRMPLRPNVFVVDGYRYWEEQLKCCEKNGVVEEGHFFRGVKCSHSHKCQVRFSDVKDMFIYLVGNGLFLGVDSIYRKN